MSEEPKLSTEIVKATVSEFHVHAILGGAGIIFAHVIEHEKLDVYISGLVVIGSFVLKRKYPQAFAHLVHIDKLPSVKRFMKGDKMVKIEGVKYIQKKSGFLVLHKY